MRMHPTPSGSPLALVLVNGLRGDHVLFSDADIAAALESAPERDPARGLPRPVADELGAAGMALAEARSLDGARELVDAMAPAARHSLIRAYFRLLERLGAPPLH